MFEAVPGLILQLFAYLTLVTSSRFALVSITMSALTTAFSVSVMYFDKDIDPACRSSNPSFYGVFPDNASSRALAFMWLFMFSVAHVLSKGFGVALFWATFGGNAVCVYYGAEVAIFILVKVIRSDFIYWVPIDGLVLSTFSAFVFRLAAKVLTDFTGFLQIRHVYEAGGLVWTLSLLWSQLSSVVCVVLYQLYYDEGEGDEKRRSKIDATAMYVTVALLVLFWLVSFSSFIRKINQKYLHTFFGTMTGSQYAIHIFRTGTSDHIKMHSVFGRNPILWISIRNEVIAFTHANWERWTLEKPDWFTEQFMATIPNDFIPRVDPNRKRSSVLRNLLGLSEAEKRHSTESSKGTSKVAAELEA